MKSFKTIKRTDYLNRLVDLKDTPDIKVITGVRRAGKSYLMRSFIDYLEQDSNNNCIVVDYADMVFEDVKNHRALYEYVEEEFDEKKNNYLFIDEVQLCSQFEVAINSFHAKCKYDIYITGSNAFLLSSDLATLFTGRYIEIHVYPFSFAEYCEYFNGSRNEESLFRDYVMRGGLSGSYAYRTDRDRVNYVKNVYETILTRDLVQKYGISDRTSILKISNFLMDNIGNVTSANNVSNSLNANKFKTNHVTVSKYIETLCRSFLFYSIKRYDIKGKKYLQSTEKLYLCDTGFRYAILGTRNVDFGRAYENIVCVELLRRGYDVYVGKLYQTEIDFIACKGSEKFYVQVADNISTSDTLTRECKPLLQIRDAYKKMIIAKTGHPRYTQDGIVICDIIEWLLTHD